MSSDFVSWFEKRMDAIFGNELTDDIIHKELVPLSHLIEKNTKWMLEVDLPGVDKKNIDVTLTDGHLVIKAKLEQPYCMLRMERTVEFDYFKKVLEIPPNTDIKNISAKFNEGILTVILPKKITGKKIPVK